MKVISWTVIYHFVALLFITWKGRGVAAKGSNDDPPSSKNGHYETEMWCSTVTSTYSHSRLTTMEKCEKTVVFVTSTESKTTKKSKKSTTTTTTTTTTRARTSLADPVSQTAAWPTPSPDLIDSAATHPMRTQPVSTETHTDTFTEPVPTDSSSADPDTTPNASTVTEAMPTPLPTAPATLSSSSSSTASTTTVSNTDSPFYEGQAVAARTNNQALGIGLGVGIGGLALLGLLAFFIYYLYKRRPERPIPLSGDEHVQTRWRPQSFLSVVAAAVAKLPRASSQFSKSSPTPSVHSTSDTNPMQQTQATGSSARSIMSHSIHRR